MSMHPDLVALRQLRKIFHETYAKNLKEVQDACDHLSVVRKPSRTDSLGYVAPVFVCTRCGAWEHGSSFPRTIGSRKFFSEFDYPERPAAEVYDLREGPNRYKADK